MSIFGALAIYFIIWWLVLFTILPWGAYSPHERGETVEKGMAPSAPVRPNLLWKFIITTIVSAVVFALVYLVLTQGWITLDDIPLLPELRD